MNMTALTQLDAQVIGEADEGNAAKEDFMSTQTQAAVERMIFRRRTHRPGVMSL